jgi:hypothetical protein
MPPSARSTVIEIVYPGGDFFGQHFLCCELTDRFLAYTFDYEMLARNVGHKVGSHSSVEMLSLNRGYLALHGME